jgi:type IV pilus assembly protein PilV
MERLMNQMAARLQIAHHRGSCGMERHNIKGDTGRYQSGVTLLEILVTVVILSLGLLGLAGLQITGLQNNRDAYNNAVAGQTLEDISERIRADLAGMRANNYDSRDLSADATQCATGVAVSFTSRTQCQLANLPGGVARIREVTGGLNAFYVAVRWNDPQLQAATAWGTDTTTNPATSACGTPAAGVKCYFSVVMP